MSNKLIAEGFGIMRTVLRGGLKKERKILLLAKLEKVIDELENEPENIELEVKSKVDAVGKVVVGSKRIEKRNGRIISHDKGGSEIIG